MTKLRIWMGVLCTLICLSAKAQKYSDDVTLVSLDGDKATIEATATGNDKKEARLNAAASAFHALFSTGFADLKSGMPMVAKMRPDYEYLLYKDGRYANFVVGEVQNLSSSKSNGVHKATVRLTISTGSLKKDVEDHNIVLNPAWQDSKKVKTEKLVNPSIVVVPLINDGDNDFEAMQSLVNSSPLVSHVVDAVAVEFARRGYKTRDFRSMLDNSKTGDILNEGTLTDLNTLVARQLPGDVVVYADISFEGDSKGLGCAIGLKAVEKQTDEILSKARYKSGRYLKVDSIALADHALKKVQNEFFTNLSRSFNDMVKEGRGVVLNFSLAESLDDWDFDQPAPVTGASFKAALEEWLRGVSHQGVCQMDVNTDKYINATLKLPLWDSEKERSYSLTNFNTDLRDFLVTQLGDDYNANITALGQKINIIIE